MTQPSVDYTQPFLTLAFCGVTPDEQRSFRDLFQQGTSRPINQQLFSEQDFRAVRPDADTVKVSFKATAGGRVSVVETGKKPANRQPARLYLVPRAAS